MYYFLYHNTFIIRQILLHVKDILEICRLMTIRNIIWLCVGQMILCKWNWNPAQMKLRIRGKNILQYCIMDFTNLLPTEHT